MVVACDQKRRAFHWQVYPTALFFTVALVFVSEVKGAPEILPTCGQDRTSLYFNGEICEDGRRIDVNVGTVATHWQCCSESAFQDIRVVASASVPGTQMNASMSLRNTTTPIFDENNHGQPGKLYSYMWENYLSPDKAKNPLTYIWEDTIFYEDNSTIVRRHECELHGIFPNNNGTTNTTPPNQNTNSPTTTGSSAETSPGSSTVSTTESSALTFYTVNKLCLIVAFLALALSIEN